jgi:beta-lactamase class A
VRVVLAAAILLLGTPAFASSPEGAVEWKAAPYGRALDDEVAAIKKRFSGTIALYVADPERGFEHGHKATEPSYLASCVKLAFMIELFRQVEKGELSFTDTVTYTEEDIRDGATVVNPKPIGTKFTMRELLEAMIQASDNAASDMIVKRIGLDRINKGLAEQGFEGFTPITRLLDVRLGFFREVDVHVDDLTPADIRTIRWTPIWDPQLAKLASILGRPKGTFTKQDLLDAYDRFYATHTNSGRVDVIGQIFIKMLRGELVSEKASKDMLELLSTTRTSTRRILGKLPPGTKVAHKTGSQYERICDLGAIWLPDGRPFVFCACIAGGEDRNGAEDVLARLARKSYDVVLADRKSAEKR